MLSYIREKAGSKIVVFIVAAIAFVFVLWGVGGYQDYEGYNILVNEERIDEVQLQKAYNNLLEQAGANKQSPLTELEMRLVMQETIRAMASQLVLTQYADKLGVFISDDEILRLIVENPLFHANGSFDKNLYQKFLKNSFGLSAANYEALLRKDLEAGRLAYLVSTSANVTEGEIDEIYHFNFDKASFNTVFFDASKYGDDFKPTEEQLKAFFETDKNAWLSPEEIKIAYTVIKPENFFKDVTVTDEQIEEYYDEYRDQFAIEPKVGVSHILFAFPENEPLTDKIKEEVRQKAEKAFERSAKENFGALAEELSDDKVTAFKGGAVGVFSRSELEPAYAEAAFSGVLNEVVGPVESTKGYYLIKVTERTPIQITPLEQVKEQIKPILVSKAAKRLAINQAEEFIERYKVLSKFEETANQFALKVEETDFFDVNNAPLIFNNDPVLIEQAFKTRLSKLGDPLEGGDDIIIYVPVEKKEPSVPAFEELKPQLIKSLSLIEGEKIAKEKAQAFIAELKAGKSWDEVIKNNNYESNETSMFARAAFFTDSILSRADIYSTKAALDELVNKGDVFKHPVPSIDPENLGYYVFSLNGTEIADPAALAEMKSNLEKNIMSFKGESYIRDLNSILMDKANIQIPDGLIK